VVETPAAVAVASELLRWIALLPLLGAAIHGVCLAVLRRSLGRSAVIGISVGGVLLSFLASCLAVARLIGLPAGERVLRDEVFTWIGAGRFSADVAFQLDPLSAVMILVVTGVGFLIHVYSIGYMDDDHRDDKGFQRFFCYLNLFTFSMLVLVLGENLLLLFLGWEGVGLCSYLLIGFWYSDRWNAYCGTKAFVVNRIGDFGFLVGILLIFWALADAGVPSVSFAKIQANFALIAERTVRLPDALGFLPGAPEWSLATLIGLCLFVGAAGKSAQLPLYVWLPDAMAGPTPVSALIHAATMVTAGVYMVCRMGFLYEAAPGAAATVAWIGALTAVFAATIAIAQTDIKKVLAYSTVSQLGYMFLAAGCGGYGAAMFHLGTHAFFKALLFLGSGAVILAMHHEQDTDRMGGLRDRIPRTHWTFLVGVFAIAGFPPLSGFFSKDAILLSAYAAESIPGHRALYAMGLGTAALTAFYMFRLHFRTFFGECRAPADVRSHIHEPAASVTVPLIVLAVLAIFAGLAGVPQVYGDWLGIPNSNSLENFLAAVLPPQHAAHVAHATEYALAALAIGAATLGAALAYLLYVRRPELPDRIAGAARGLYELVRNKYWVDELYDAAIVRPTVFVSERVLFRGVDAGLIDGGLVNGTARAIRALAASGLKYAHAGLAQGYLFAMLIGAAIVVAVLVR
jgi:NADH-quinone oxidoreductase subunit L